MKKELQKLNYKLTPENRQIIKKIRYYLESHYLNQDYLEETMSDIVGMALESQERGEDFSNTVGVDYEVFCRELVDISPRQTYIEKIFNTLISLVICVGLVLPLMYIFGLVFDTDESSKVISKGLYLISPIAYILKYILIVVILHMGWVVVKRSIYKSQSVILGIYVGTIVLALILSDYISMMREVFSVSVETNILIWLGVFIVAIAILFILKAIMISVENTTKKKIEDLKKRKGEK